VAVGIYSIYISIELDIMYSATYVIHRWYVIYVIKYLTYSIQFSCVQRTYTAHLLSSTLELLCLWITVHCHTKHKKGVQCYEKQVFLKRCTSDVCFWLKSRIQVAPSVKYYYQNPIKFP
jgi:hypothetical protein